MRQEELAVMFGVGIATLQRWERKVGTRPTGLPLQMYEIMNQLRSLHVDLKEVRTVLLDHGNAASIRWLLNKRHEMLGGK
jgi:transposase